MGKPDIVMQEIRATAAEMPRFECTVCKLPAADREAVEKQLAAGTKFRDLAQQCSLSKSALRRHWSPCVNRRRLAEIRQRRAVTAESRVAVWWPGDPEPDADVVVVVVYETLGLVKNPAALRTSDPAEIETAHDAEEIGS